MLEKIEADAYDVIILNYANADMVGHTGYMDAAVKAVETVDECLSKVVSAIIEKGGQALITADHGNSEQMGNNDDPFTAHTANLVPLYYVGGPKNKGIASGILADLAPTMLDILNIEKPDKMTGESLIIDNE